MVAGYLLTRYKAAPIKITPAINFVGWTVSLGMMFLLVFGIWNGTLSLLWTALYVSVGHTGTHGLYHFNRRRFTFCFPLAVNVWGLNRNHA